MTPQEDTVERVHALAGPSPDHPEAYWRALAAWDNWAEWLPAERPPARVPDWRQ